MKIKNSLIIFFLFLAFLTFVVASHNITLNTSQSVNQSISVLYNISVNNSDSGQTANITQVNITLPNNNFTFVSGTNGSDSIGVFSNTSSVLSWSNSSGYLINGSAVNYFWFNLTASYPGTYNITVTTLNSTGIYSSNFSVVVNDTIGPAITFVNPVSNGNISGSSYVLNATIVDYSAISSVYFNITNSSGNVTSLKNATNTSINSWNATLNTTALAEGLYNFSLIANDSINNINSSVVALNVRIDYTPPSVPQIFSTSITNTSIKFNITVSDSGSKVHYCNYRINSGNAINADYVNNTLWSVSDGVSCEENNNYNVTCFDYAGNSISNNTNFTSSDCISDSSSSGSSSGNSGDWVWSTISYTDEEFSYKLSINRNMSEKDRISIKFNGETHYIGIIDIKTSSVVINVSSNPQQATINVGSSYDFNINGDNYSDIRVKVNSLNSTKVNLTMSYIHELISTSSNNNAQSNSNANISNNSSGNLGAGGGKVAIGSGWIIIVIIVIIIIVIGIIIVWFATNKGANPFKSGKDKYLEL